MRTSTLIERVGQQEIKRQRRIIRFSSPGDHLFGLATKFVKNTTQIWLTDNRNYPISEDNVEND